MKLSRNLRLRFLILFVIVPLIAGGTTGIAFGNTTHLGTASGTHSSGSHGNNPAHLWVDVHWSNYGYVSSGGRYHDPASTCPSGSCGPAFYGGDSAVDIGAAPNASSSLWLNYAGWSNDVNSTNPPDNNRPIYIYARAFNGSISGSDPACEYQRYEVHVFYFDTGGTYRDAYVGNVWILHNYNWTTANGGWISPNGVMANPYGTSTVYFINGVQVSQVYPSGGLLTCSNGAHTHMEFESKHNWGAFIENHSSGGPDFYSIPYSHVHNGGGYNHAPRDDTNGAYAWLGWLGGGATGYTMVDNPYYVDH